MTVRQIAESLRPDSPTIVEIVQLFREAREQTLQFALVMHSEEEDRHFLANVVLPKNRIWVAELEGRIVGFIAFADGWVNHLYIAPSCWRRGIGSRLLTIAKEAEDSLQLWAFQVNEPAIKFYKSHGFAIVQHTDGSGNEEKMPDVRMQWRK